MASPSDARSNEHEPREHSGDGMPASADARGVFASRTQRSEGARSWTRAGLLRPPSLAPSTGSPDSAPTTDGSPSDPAHVPTAPAFSCTPADIRLTTLQLSAMLAHPPSASLPSPHAWSAPDYDSDPDRCAHALGPHQMRTPLTAADLARAAGAAGYGSFGHVHGLGQSYPRRAPAPVSPHEVRSPQSTSAGSTPASPSTPTPSGLSLLLAQKQRRADPPPPPPRPTAPEDAPPQTGSESTSRAVPAAPRAGERTPLLAPPAPDTAAPDLERAASASSRSSSRARPPTPAHPRQHWWSRTGSGGAACIKSTGTGAGVDAAPGLAPLASLVSRDAARALGAAALRSVPAVLLGVLLNVLDGVSYGMIMFPANAVFPAFGGVGVSMFFVTTIIAQLAYSCGASGFAGANGSMMIEVVPFFHILAADVARELGEERAAEVVATTLAAFALSAVLTGLAFFALGGLRLGAVVGFFPRHILVGCIGGVGVFLIETGLTVCARIDDDDFTYTLDTLKFFLDAGVLVRWLPALALAVLLRAITHRFHHQLIFPAYFLAIPVLFYAIVGAARLDVSALRRAGWLFDMGGTDEAWYTFYSYYSFKKTSFRALWVTMPTQFALLFFNILHPPLNVPALAVSLDEDVDTNKELVAHGYSVVNGGKADCRPL
ncbi:sulfate transporter family-domain-containing protein [Phellopilus nigrolimitatus]|nr:sulfate transporter family-domain-containing protein [Phellopilus nigrolimitatus]